MNKPAIFVAAAAVTAGTLAAALALGSWAFKHRSALLHLERLQRLTALHPLGPSVEAGIAQEGGRLVGRASTTVEMEALARRFAPGEEASLLAQGSKFKTMRVFAVERMVYFLFFDADDKLQDYAVMPATGAG